MDKVDYDEHYELLLNEWELYEKLDTNSTLNYVGKVKQKIEKSNYVKNRNIIIRLKIWRIHEHLHLWIHKKNFFPPSWPIVSCNLSKFDSFLKFQDQKCKRYIKDTKCFIVKLSSIKNIPENRFYITRTVSSHYSKINHEEGKPRRKKK